MRRFNKSPWAVADPPDLGFPEGQAEGGIEETEESRWNRAEIAEKENTAPWNER